MMSLSGQQHGMNIGQISNSNMDGMMRKISQDGQGLINVSQPGNVINLSQGNGNMQTHVNSPNSSHFQGSDQYQGQPFLLADEHGNVIGVMTNQGIQSIPQGMSPEQFLSQTNNQSYNSTANQGSSSQYISNRNSVNFGGGSKADPGPTFKPSNASGYNNTVDTQYNQGFLRGQSPESSSTASKSRGHRKIGMSDLSQSSQLTSSTSLRSHGSHSESKTSDNKYGNNYDSASRISGHSQNYGHFGNEHNANDSHDRLGMKE